MEVKEALFGMHPNKAPEQDGLHLIFFQRTWGVLGQDICETLNGWFSEGNVSEHLCEPTICLIPKQYPPETARHLRPISSCNTL